MDLAGKRVLVTGGSRGIGAAVAHRVAQHGAAVAVNYRVNRDSAEALVTELRSGGATAIAVGGDVSDPDVADRVVDDAVEQLGGLDGCVSNAGVEHFGALEDITPKDVEHVFGVNTFAQLWVTRAAARHLGAGGRIVLMSSVSATLPVFQHSLYAASKAAVSALVRNLAVELGPREITINAVAPGGTMTEMAAAVAKNYAPPQLRGVSREQITGAFYALGRLARPAEIAAVVAFLLSDDASFITGATMSVDGGRS